MQNLKNYNNEEFWNSWLLGVIWNSLNLTWTKYFINFHHFENSSNYYPNKGIHIKVFKFPQNIPWSKHTLRFCFGVWKGGGSEGFRRLEI